MARWAALVRLARPHAAGLALVAGLMLLAVALEVVKPWPMKLLVDHALAGRPLPDAAAWLDALPGAGTPAGQVAWLAGATVLIFALLHALVVAQSAAHAAVGGRMVSALGAALFEHAQRLSPASLGRRATGDLVRRLTTDVRCVRDLVLAGLLPLATALVSLVAMFAVMWRLDRRLSLVAAAFALPLGLAIWRFASPMT